MSIERIESGCQHWIGRASARKEGEEASLSEGFCPYCHVLLELLPIAPYCNCCKWYWEPIRLVPRPAENAEAPGVIHTESPCENEHEKPVDE